MRRRLLRSTLAAVAAAVFLLGLPLAIAVRGSLVRAALDRLQAEAERAQVVLNAQAVTPAQQAVLLSALASDAGVRFTLFDVRGGGVVRIDTGAPPPGSPASACSASRPVATRTTS